MIRFSCPGCGAVYSVDDAKGGKTGKCPKCQTQFQIPMPEGAGPPPPPAAEPPATLPPPPPSDPNAPVEIEPCPGCQARLSVAAADLGADVECPYCKRVYKAVQAGARPPAPPRRPEPDEAGGRPRRRAEEDEDDRPSRRRRRDEDEFDEDRPSRRRREEDEEDDRPSRRRRDEDEEDRPRRRRRRVGGSYEPHRGGVILGLGIFGFLCCGIAAVAAVIMGTQDLNKMGSGQMDPDGKTMTIIGMVFGVLGILLWIAGIVLRFTMR
jgi:predicted Zn finger-like uncharacterized protein